MITKYDEIVKYIGLHKLPKGFEEAYALYTQTLQESEEQNGEPNQSKNGEPNQNLKQPLIARDYYEALLSPHNLPGALKDYLDAALQAIEQDEKVLWFSRFLVWDMCSMRNKYDIDNYTELVPSCLEKYNDAYGFLILLACVPVSEEEMKRRGIPKAYYEDIPHRMIRLQVEKYERTGEILVDDMPWKLNFYSLSIFLLDRFLFIPYEHGENFRFYRNKLTGKVIGLNGKGCMFDKEGQLLSWGFDGEEPKDPSNVSFVTTLDEDATSITGYYMNPCGFTQNQKITLNKSEYDEVLREGDYLVALHIPEGEGYTPERMRNSCRLALEFFGKYYPELDMKGFWSSSWLYDKRLELLIGKNRNITNCQDIMYRYSDGEDGEMAYVHLFKSTDQDLKTFQCTTSLQSKAKDFLLHGNRFCTTGMMILKEEIESEKLYQTPEDEKAFFDLMKQWGIA